MGTMVISTRRFSAWSEDMGRDSLFLLALHGGAGGQIHKHGNTNNGNKVFLYFLNLLIFENRLKSIFYILLYPVAL